MARLPGWSFMLVGLVMVGYSRFIEAKRPEANLAFFFWIGIAFLAFGFLREVTQHLERKKRRIELVGPPPARNAQPHDHRHPATNPYGASSHETHQHLRPHPHPSHPHENRKSCPRCHRWSAAHARFCHSCGYVYY